MMQRSAASSIDISVLPFVRTCSANDAWAVLSNKYVSTTETSKQLMMQKMSACACCRRVWTTSSLASTDPQRGSTVQPRYPDALLRSIFLQAVRARSSRCSSRQSSGERDALSLQDVMAGAKLDEAPRAAAVAMQMPVRDKRRGTG
jgi:hypothetical protein